MQVFIKASQDSNYYPLGLCNSSSRIEFKCYRASVYAEGLGTLSQLAFLDLTP